MIITAVFSVIFLTLAALLLRWLIAYLHDRRLDSMVKPVEELSTLLDKAKDSAFICGQEIFNEALTNAKNRFEEEVITPGLNRIFQAVFPEADKSYDSIRNYAYIITEDKIHPFQITPEIARITRRAVAQNKTDRDRMEAILNWFKTNIKYDYERYRQIQSGRKVNYRHALETYADRKGVCGEIAILYVVMCRAAGLTSRYVYVEIDCQGNQVSHACTAVMLDSVWRLSDASWGCLFIQHRRFTIMNDEQAINHFKLMRNI